MKHRTWRVGFGVGLVALSLALYGLHYLIFRDFHHIAIYSLGDLAFLPLEVLFVTLILHELLEGRARAERVDKLNMVIGAFFSEVGNELLVRLTERAESTDDVRLTAAPRTDWDDARFQRAARDVNGMACRIRLSPEDLRSLRDFLVARRDFLLRLLENPALLEHESFSDLLWAVFHLTEELESRTRFEGLPPSDLAHLSGDAERAYTRLLGEWIRHARHLKECYPYLYSLLVRTNPLDPTASAEVTS